MRWRGQVGFVGDFRNEIHNLELRHPHFVCNKKVQCKEVKTQQVDLWYMILIERHVSAYSPHIAVK